MKTLRFYFKLASLLVTMLAVQVSYGQTFEKERSVNKSFKLSAETEIEVSNKYGDVHIVPWEKDSVRFEIKLKVITNKETKLDKAFDYVDFDFKATKYYVIASTVFVGKGTFWTEVSDVANNLFSAGTKTTIDYTIYLPAKSTLKVDNKYGNIYTTDLSGTLNITLSNGDLKAHRFSGTTTMNTEFGNIDIQIIDNGNLTISYGELQLESSTKLTLTSRSSEIEIDEVTQLNLESKRDKLNLESVGTLIGQTYFTTLKVDELNTKIDLTSKYGSTELEKLGKMKSFLLKSDDSDIKLNFAKENKYTLDLTVDEKTQVYYSADITNIKTVNLGGDDKLISVKSTIGSGTQTPLNLKLDVRAGTVSLKLK
ncbi:MAG TPA: hypothetical protein VIN10_12075 [Bacteroidales bacterium]